MTHTIRSLARRLRALAPLLAAGVVLAGCAGGSSSPTTLGPVVIGVSVSPASTNVQLGGVSKAFTATVTNASNTSVSWQVDGVAGGNSTVGTISEAGLYLSPATMPSSSTVTVTAVAAADTTKSDSAAVSLTSAAAIGVSVSPSSASVVAGSGTQAFTATVTNASNTAVTWKVNGTTGGNSTVGTISSSGLYTAPATVPAQPTVTVTAVSVADTSKSASSSVTITTTAAAVAVAVSPKTASVLVPGATQTFMATVSHAANTAVTWKVNGTIGGSSTTGTISTGGVYTAPSTLPSTRTVTVSAVSVQDTSKSDSATVTLMTRPPTISGTPATSVLVGQAYDFKPTASDPSGLPMTFSITGIPSWATFNTSTGELSGTPQAADVSSSSIKITVADANASASLSFSLAVVATATGSASLSWVAPTTRTDGTSLTNLSGFRIYYGKTATSLTNTMSVSGASTTTAVVGTLTTGTWYFAVTALDTSGNESNKSNVASKTI